MEHRHLWDVHYLEFKCVFNYEAQGDSSFVKTKQRYEIYIYIYIY